MALDVVIAPASGLLEYKNDTLTDSLKLLSDGKTLTIRGTDASDLTRIKIEGTQGVLFSVSDDFSSLLSVNDISGLPVLEVLPDNTVALGYNGNDWSIGSSNYFSGYLGGGTRWWSLNGSSYFEIDNLTVRNTLRTHIFQKDIVRASNGYLFITDVSEIVADTLSSSGEIYTKEQVFQNGDLAWYKDADNDGSITGLKITITSAGVSTTLPNSTKTGYRYTYTVYNGTGTFRSGGTIARVGGGTGRQGSIYFDASSTGSPFMDIYDGVATWTDFQSTSKVKVRTGNLSGITDTDFGGALSGYGFYGAGNIYIKGKIVALAGGKIAGWTIGDTALTANAGSQIVIGNMKIGDNVNGTYDGIFLDANNYWYADYTFKFGTASSYLSGSNTAGITINTSTFTLIAGNLTLDTTKIKFGASTSKTDTTNAGVWIDGSAGEMVISSGSSNYIKKTTTGIDIASQDFELNSGNLAISGNTTSSYIKVGSLADATTTATTNSGFRVDNSGNALLKGNTSGSNYIKVTAAGTVDLNSTSFTLTGSTTLLIDTAQILLGATTYASAKIGLKNDGSGKLANGNLSWDTSGNTTLAGTLSVSGTATLSGTIQTAASGARIVVSSSGIDGYDATTQRFDLSTTGSGWFGASNKFYWDSTGSLTVGGWTINNGSITSTDMEIVGGTYPHIGFWDQVNGNDYITLGRRLYDGSWHDDWNGMIFRANSQNWFQMYTTGDGATRVAKISNWNFDGDALWIGSKQNLTGFTNAIGDITISTVSGISTKTFYSDLNGNTGISGTLSISDSDNLVTTFYAGQVRKNLLPYSSNFQSTVGWNNNGGGLSLDISTFPFPTLKTGTVNNAGINTTIIRLKPDTVYTYSATVYSNVAGSLNGNDMVLHIQCWRDEDTGNPHQDTQVSANTTYPANTWKRISLTFRTPVSAAEVYARFYFWQFASGTFWIKDVQVEEGPIATPHQPTDGPIVSEYGYGAWSNNFGIGGTMQNPMLAADSKSISINALLTSKQTLYVGQFKKNLLSYSQTFSNAVWNYRAGLTVTQGQTAPDGSSTAVQIAYVSGDGLIWQAWSLSPSTTYTLSCWAKGTGSFKFHMWDGVLTQLSNTITATSNWKRYSFTFTTASSSAGGNGTVDILSGSSSLLLWGFQLELGSSTSDYQVTDSLSLWSTSDYGLWSSLGGFAGTPQNPLIQLTDAGLGIRNVGTTTNVTTTNGTYIGNWQSKAGFYGTILNHTGLYGYINNVEVFHINGSDAKIGGFTINSSNIVSGTKQAAGSVYVGTDGIWLGTTFGVTSAGVLTASSVDLTGKITASTGSIGGFTIGTNLTYGSKTAYDDANSGIFIGVTGIGLGTTFKVSAAGVLTASSVDLTGKITASSGSIGGFTIGTNLTTGSKAAYDDALAGIFIGSTGIGLGTTFKVSAAGALTASSVDLTGKITASSGSIGGFTIGTNLTTGTKAAYDDANAGIFIGATGIGLGTTFKVSSAGVLTASSVDLSGKITATSGKVGNWNIDSDSIYVGTKVTNGNYTAVGALTISSTGFISANQFRIDTDGSAHFKGDITGATGTIGDVVLGVTGITATSGGYSLTSAGLAITKGSITINVNKFVVDTSGNVTIAGTAGISGTTTIGGTLTVNGTTTLGGTLSVTGAITVGSGGSIASTGKWSLNNDGSASFCAGGANGVRFNADGTGNIGNGFSWTSAGAVTFSGALSAASGSFNGSICVNTNKFVVDASGNVTIAGTAGISGTTTLGGTLSLTGAMTLGTGGSITSTGKWSLNTDGSASFAGGKASFAANGSGSLGSGISWDTAGTITLRGNLEAIQSGATGSGNLCAGKTFVTDTSATSTVPGDGTKVINSSTYCNFGNGLGTGNSAETIYLQVDLGASYRLSCSRIYFYAYDQRSYWYKLKYSVDGTTWYYAAGIPQNTGWVSSPIPKAASATGYLHPTVNYFYPQIVARYVRLYCDGSTANAGAHVYEWELFSNVPTDIEPATISAISGKIGSFTIDSSSINTGGYYTSGTMYFGTSGISISNSFKVSSAGALTASSVDLTGKITASTGSVGGFTIGTNLTSGSKAAYNDSNAGIFIGSTGIGLGTMFNVSAAGVLTASSGTIAGWGLNANSFYNSNGNYFLEINKFPYIYAGYGQAQWGDDNYILMGMIPASAGVYSGQIGLLSRDSNGTGNNYFVLTNLTRLIGGICFDSTSLYSSNYDATNGFKINSDGSATFNNVNIRGNIHALSGTFEGNITSSAIITGGTFQTASSGKRIVISDSEQTVEFYDTTARPGGSVALDADFSNLDYPALFTMGRFHANNDISTAGDLDSNSKIIIRGSTMTSDFKKSIDIDPDNDYLGQTIGITINNDTNIYRAGVDLLKTDDSLIIGAGNGASTLQLISTAANTGLTIGADTNLYRSAANILKTDDSLIIGAGNSVYTLQLTSTAANTGIAIGGDTTLYRSAANWLKTDDHLEVAGWQYTAASWRRALYLNTGSSTCIQLNSTTTTSNSLLIGNSAGGFYIGLTNGSTQTDTVAYKMSLDTSGNVIFAGNVTANTAPSDSRIKKDVVPFESVLGKIDLLKPVRFKYNELWSRPNTDGFGFIAQELAEIFPDLVFDTKMLHNDMTIKAVYYEKLTPILVKAIQELKDKISILEKKMGDVQ